ncbi:uncharacterized protein LOC105198020 [Solenopsis invicta]|uniref:uncharacterized protein LOC105198020 n=1 Tax=Solenopsis invicta TaxID=13686 RepID=UPI000595ED64|nr:uncharacterized protein LOC105198020 [Solenopsis invicta]
MEFIFHREYEVRGLVRGADSTCRSPDGDTAINNCQARRRKLDQYGRDYEIRSLCKAVGEGRAGVAPQSNSRGVRLTSSGKRASPGDGFFGDLTEEGERLLFNLQPPRYQPLLTLYPQIIAPLRSWPYAPNAGSVPPRSRYSAC